MQYSYDYDSNGNLISVVDLQKNKTKYDYDSNNNLVKMTLPNGASQTYTYDSYHNVTKAVSPEGVTSQFTYDTDYLVAGLCGGLGGLNVGRTASAIIGAVTGFVGSIYDNTTSGKKVSFGELILDATLAAGFGALNSVLDPGFNSTGGDKLSGRIQGTAKKAMDKISAGKPVTKVVKNALRSDVKRVAASAISGFGVGFAYSMTFWGSRKAGNAIYRAYR